MKDFQIVIPSRGRPENMKRMMSLLPSAVVYVDEREEKAYSRVVPKEKLFLHEPTETHVQMRTALGRDDRFPHTLVGVDDDLVAVNFHPGRRSRRTQDGEVIESVIRSTAQVARDLDIKLFGWARFAHPGLFQMHNPITSLLQYGRMVIVFVDSIPSTSMTSMRVCNACLSTESAHRQQVLLRLRQAARVGASPHCRQIPCRRRRIVASQVGETTWATARR